MLVIMNDLYYKREGWICGELVSMDSPEDTLSYAQSDRKGKGGEPRLLHAPSDGINELSCLERTGRVRIYELYDRIVSLRSWTQ